MQQTFIGRSFLTITILAIPAISSASPLVEISVLGRVAGSGASYSSTVPVVPGQTVEYQVWAKMAPIGTYNSNNYSLIGSQGGGSGQTINSLTASTGIQAGDGIQSMFLDVYQNPADPIQVNISPVRLNDDPTPMANDTWASLVLFSGTGKPRANGYQDLQHIRPIHNPGIRTAVDPEVVFTGSFDIPSDAAGPISFVRVRWSTDLSSSGNVRVNGTDSFAIVGHHSAAPDPTIYPGTEFGPDPIVGFTQATALNSPDDIHSANLGLMIVPEPTTLSLLGIASLGLLARRRVPRK